MFRRQVMTEQQAQCEKAEYESKGHQVWSVDKVIAPNKRDVVWELSVSIDNDANRKLWNS